MLHINAYFLAKIGADTAENEQHFAEILPIGRRVADRDPSARRSTASRGGLPGRGGGDAGLASAAAPGGMALSTQRLLEWR